MITAGKSYMQEVRHLPLMPIRDRKHLREANGIIAKLAALGDKRTDGQTEYLKVLMGLVADYESQEFAHLRAQMTQGEIVKSLLETSGLSQNALAKIAEIPQPRISDIIQGNRALSKDQTVKLCAYFNLSADLLLFAPLKKGTASKRPVAGKSKALFFKVCPHCGARC